MLDFTNEKGIIPRDIKHEKIKSDAKRGLISLNFGIAKYVKMNQPQTAMSMGTPIYMAPE